MPPSDSQLPDDCATQITGPWANPLNDQRESWLRGECLGVEHYVKHVPCLADSPEGIGTLVGAEMRLRENRGESPALDEYLQRFPQLSAYLRQRFAPESPPGDRTVRFPTALLPLGGQASAVAPTRPQVPGYEILGEVGRGAMGVIYKARQVKLDRIVALKMMLLGPCTGEEEVARFRNEAESIARLHHPNIVQIYEVGEAAGHPYFALEFIDGGNLAAQRSSILRPSPWAAQLIALVARAVHHSHQRNIIHRDLKPANILFQRRGEETGLTDDYILRSPDWPACVPKVTDFGLAKRIDLAGDQTRTGTLLGTPNFMAPEQAAGERQQVGPAADIYALGAILYDLLTGRPPFQGDSMLAVLQQARSAEPIAPSRLNPKVPQDLETICLKCLEKDPHARYQSASDLADDLTRFLHDEPIQARPASVWRTGWKWVKRQPLFAALVGMVIFATVALTFLTFFAYWSSHRLIDNRKRMKNALEVLIEHQRLSSSVMDAETSERGYLLTGDKAHLVPYDQAIQQIHPTLDRLEALTNDNPQQLERLNVLRGLIEDRLQKLEEVIAQREQPDGLGASVRAEQAGHGKRNMDEVRTHLATFEAKERELLVRRDAEVDTTTRTATLTLIVGVFFAGTLLIAAAFPLLGVFILHKRR